MAAGARPWPNSVAVSKRINSHIWLDDYPSPGTPRAAPASNAPVSRARTSSLESAFVALNETRDRTVGTHPSHSERRWDARRRSI